MNNKIDVIQEDRLCKICMDWNGFIAYYNWDMTPKPRHREWIELQCKIFGRKMFARDWSMKFIRSASPPRWEVRGRPNKRVRKSDKQVKAMQRWKEIE